MLKRIVIKKNEKGVLFRDGDYERVLNPGRYHFFDPLKRLTVQVWKLDAPMNDMAMVDYLLQREAQVAAECFDCMELGEDEAGLRFENDILVEVLAPASRRVFWKGLVKQRLEKVDLKQGYALERELTAHFAQPALRGRSLAGLNGLLLVQVPAYFVGVLKVDGKVERLLQPGLEAFWRYNRDIEVELLDTRLQLSLIHI